MPEENPQDQSAEEDASLGSEGQGEGDSQEYVSTAELEALATR